jgi:hypothetical protein
MEAPESAIDSLDSLIRSSASPWTTSTVGGTLIACGRRVIARTDRAVSGMA